MNWRVRLRRVASLVGDPLILQPRCGCARPAPGRRPALLLVGSPAQAEHHFALGEVLKRRPPELIRVDDAVARALVWSPIREGDCHARAIDGEELGVCPDCDPATPSVIVSTLELADGVARAQ